MTTTLPAIVTERKSKSEILTDLWKKICNKLYVPVHSMNEVTSKLFAETKEFPDGDSHFVITRLIEKCKSNGKLLDAIMQEQKSYAKAFDYFYSKAGTYGFKMKHGCYLDNKKALELAEEYFMLDDAEEYYKSLFSQIKDVKVKSQIELELIFDGDIKKYRAAIKEELAYEERLKRENPDEYKSKYEVTQKTASKKKSAKKSVKKVKKKELTPKKPPVSTSAVKEAVPVSEVTKTVTESKTKAAEKKEPVETNAFSQMSIWDLM